MKRIVLTFFIACFSLLASAQLNMTLLDQIDYTQVCSSLWGYIDPEDSTEYAAVGTSTGLSIVSLEDPTNIQEIKFIPDVNSQWREVKSYGHYIYAVTEGGGGVLVVNMTDAPDNITSTHWAPNIPGLGTLNSIHSITVDEFGYLYLNGTNLHSGGVLIVDVSADDGNPVYVGKAPAIYCHDSYARNNILYTSDIYAGVFSVYDVSDKSNVQLLATQATPFLFTHNTWLNDSSTVIFTTDEKANAPVGAYDISDLDNIVELDQFRPTATLGQGVIPHNVHVWNDWVITAYYTDGTIIIDGSRPENLIEVGYFDSFVSQTAGFFGIWGVYPYFPSGLVIASDIQNGLLVYDVNYVRACWLEGKVTSSATGLPVNGVSVHIASTQANSATTNATGDYKTGQAIAGTFEVTFSATGYVSKTVQAVLENGVLTILDVQLDPLSSFTLLGQTVRTLDGNPVPNAQVVLKNDQTSYSITTDANGNFTLNGIFGGTYDVYAAAWGYLHRFFEDVNIGQNSPPLVISMSEGYQDDFFANMGWTSTQTASSGFWVRGVPVGTDFNGQAANPGLDVPEDLGDQCYVTGNGGGGAGNDDVDNGTVTLTSPAMDLSNYNEPVLKYRTWFFNGGGNGQPNDALQVRISNGTTEVVLETISQSQSQWRPQSSFNLSGLIPLTNNMKVIFETGDLQSSGHLVEAAVDAFLVEDAAEYPPFSADVTNGCAPLTVQFTDNGTEAVSWSWSFPGGNPATSTEAAASVTYDAPGVYDVVLTVVTGDGTTYAIEKPGFITVNAAPSADFNYVVNGAVVTFSNLSGNGSYTWNFGDGSTSSEENPVHSYQQVGTYTVTLSAENSCGAVTYSQVVEITAVPPTAAFSASVTSGCAPLTIQFSDLSNGNPDNWTWEFPGGNPATSTEQNPAVTYDLPGVYNVLLKISNAAGQSQAELSQLIEVGDKPSANFGFNASDENLIFTNLSVNASSYVWDFGDGTTSTEGNPTHSYSMEGNYEVTLSATNDCGTSAFSLTVPVLVSAQSVVRGEWVLTAAPNPFQQETVLDYALDGSFPTARLMVYNALGLPVGSLPLAQSSGRLSVGAALPAAGVYFLQIVAEGQMSKVLRVVKL
jgi:choice-of-anchor B domain-containing protein